MARLVGDIEWLEVLDDVLLLCRLDARRIILLHLSEVDIKLGLRNLIGIDSDLAEWVHSRLFKRLRFVLLSFLLFSAEIRTINATERVSGFIKSSIITFPHLMRSSNWPHF